MASSVDYLANPFIVCLRDSAARSANQTWTPPAKCRVLDAWLVLRGAAAGTIDIQNGASQSISGGTVTLASGDTDIQACPELDDDYVDLVPGTHVLTIVPASSPICDVYVLLGWVA